ncbi:MAG: hypothetical protein K940chlam2_00439 [Chlamydiae bacterium]|nr:hypothetical protein [Chlamydiota bacterium]
MELLTVTAPDGESYQITFNPIKENLKGRMPHSELNRYEYLVEQAQEKPREAVEDIEAFAKKNDRFPEVLNLLTYVCAQKKQVKRVEELIGISYEKHPDYFFARVNYADQCLRRKKLGEFARVFPELSLKRVCPNQKTFHYSQYRGLMVLFGFYRLARGEDATPYLEAAKAVEPMHISVLLLERKIKRKKGRLRSWLFRR